MKFVAAFVLSLALTFGAIGTADATRPRTDFKYKDQCYNIAGKQPIYMLFGTGPYRFKHKTPAKHDCRYVG